jgi:hypothetical protein
MVHSVVGAGTSNAKSGVEEKQLAVLSTRTDYRSKV